MLFGSSFGSSAFGYAPPPLLATTDDVSFDGYGLQNAKITVSEANFDDSGESEFNTYPLPRRDGTGFLSRFWRKKRITLRGIVKGTDASDMEAVMDEMKRSLSGTEKTLQRVTANGTRKITATLVSANFDRRHYHISFCPFTLTFESQDAFWYDASNQSFSAAVTSSPYVESLDNGGSAPADPRILLAFVSASSVTQVSFSANNKTVTLSGAFSAGDVLEFNGETKTALVNGTETDYGGTFPELLTGSNLCTLAVDGTFSADFISVWRKNYL